MSNFTDYSPTADVFIGVSGILLGSCTILANTLVIAIISKFEKRTNSELIFLNIAVTDVVGGLDALFAFSILFARRQFFDFHFLDDIICQMMAITWRVTSVVTPLMLSLTSLGRFLAVYTPHRYEGMFSKRNVIICLALFWTVSTGGATMHLFKSGTSRMEPAWGFCDYRLIELYSTTQTRVIVTILYTIPLAFSTVLLVSCNAAICIKLVKMRQNTQKRIKKKISVANGLGAVLPTNIAVADTSAARRYDALRARLANANQSPLLAAATRKVFAKSTRFNDNRPSVCLGTRITATEAPSKIHQEKLINTNVFELNVVLMETLQCALGFESPGCSGVSTPESSVNLPDRTRLTPNRSPPSMSPLASPALDTRASPLLVPDRNLPASSPAPGRSIYSSRLSPLPPELMRKTEKRVSYHRSSTPRLSLRASLTLISPGVSYHRSSTPRLSLRASLTSSSLIQRFRRSFLAFGSSDLGKPGLPTSDILGTSPAPKRLSNKKLKKKGRVRRRELDIVTVTALFTLNFVMWNSIILFYYFTYIISPSDRVLSILSGDNLMALTYLNGWFYYATFLTSSVNPIIHFVCNSKIKAGYKTLQGKIVSGLFSLFNGCHCK